MFKYQDVKLFFRCDEMNTGNTFQKQNKYKTANTMLNDGETRLIAEVATA